MRPRDHILLINLFNACDILETSVTPFIYRQSFAIGNVHVLARCGSSVVEQNYSTSSVEFFPRFVHLPRPTPHPKVISLIDGKLKDVGRNVTREQLAESLFENNVRQTDLMKFASMEKWQDPKVMT